VTPSSPLAATKNVGCERSVGYAGQFTTPRGALRDDFEVPDDG
jgi:hypothetical protein